MGKQLYLSRDELASTLLVSTRKVDEWVAKGLPHIRDNRIVRFDAEMVDRWLVDTFGVNYSKADHDASQ